MAVPLKLHNMTEYLHTLSAPHDRRNTGCEDLLQFPKSTCVLWDGTSTGPAVYLHLTQYRKPRLAVGEKVLWLINKQINGNGTSTRFLVGSLSVDDDAEGVCICIDGINMQQLSSDSSMVQGEITIPVNVSCSSNQDRTGSVDDYVNALKVVQRRCQVQGEMELRHLVHTQGWCGFYSHPGAEKTVCHLQFDVVTVATVFKATPVNPVPIFPTALAKSLGEPRGALGRQGKPKVGYLCMDQTRKLILVLESDPKVARLPIIGIWVSGVSLVQHPFVWASCLRYLHYEKLQDRVCVPPDGFLLVLFTLLHSKPEFYEVCTVSGKSEFQFDLYTGYEITSLLKKSAGAESAIIEWELNPTRNGPKQEKFDIAIEKLKLLGQQKPTDSRSSGPSLQTTSDDINPRLKPAPHFHKTMTVRPVVPEVSMIWNDSVPPPSSQGGAPYSTSSQQHLLSTVGFSSKPPGLPLAPAYSLFTSLVGVDRQQVNSGLQESDSTPRTAVSSPAVKSNAVQIFPAINSQAWPRTVQACMGGVSLTPSFVPTYPHPAQPSWQPYGNGTASEHPPPELQHACQPKPNTGQSFVEQASVRYPCPSVTRSDQHVVQQGFMMPPPFSQIQNHQADSVRLTPQILTPSPWFGHHSPYSLGTVSQPTQQQLIMPVCLNSSQNSLCSTQPPVPPSTVLPEDQIFQENAHLMSNPVSHPSSSHTLPLLSASCGNSVQEDSSSSSGKLSNDSGLSVTPDCPSPSPKPGFVPPSGAGSGEVVSLQGMNWSSMPSEVVQLLLQQDAQLKMLQAQIQQLLALQQASASSSSPSCSTNVPSSTEPAPKPVLGETRSTAVNTSLINVPGEMPSLPCRIRLAQCVSVQTSPQKTLVQSQSPLSQDFPTTTKEDCHDEASTSSLHYTHTAQGVVSSPGAAQCASFSKLETLTLSQAAAELHQKMTPKINNSDDKDGFSDSRNMDHPSSTRPVDSIMDASYLTPSPQSASTCVRPDEEENENSGKQISPDSKEYYDQLINNIKLFLDNHSKEEVVEMSSPHPDDLTCTHLKLWDSTLGTSFPACPSGAGSSNTTMTPHINYLSMMLESESSDASMEINAMAMKYLRDEQLTHMARFHQASPHRVTNNNHHLLRQVLAASLDVTESCSNLSHLGTSLTNMSMATKRYMERHGLLGGDGGESLLDSHQTMRLQTDFSLALASEASGGCAGSDRWLSGFTPPKKISPGMQSPVKQEILQPTYQLAPVESSCEESQSMCAVDLGASPVLRPPPKHIYQQRHLNTGDSPIFPERYSAPHWQQDFDQCSVATEDDRILDIEKLKQMPKLL